MTTRDARKASRTRRVLITFGALLLVSLTASKASAQVAPNPDRDKTWRGVTNVTALAGLGAQLITPRIFYPAPEVTVGWKARWHASQLAPVMTLATITLVNEVFLKDRIAGNRPGCDDSNQGLVQNCQDFGAPSSHSFAAASAFGHGVAVFLVDTMKWSDGRVNGLSVVANIALPLVLGGITLVGRSSGNFESGGQIATGATLGLGFGFLTGLMYAEMARPECGYSGSLFCW
jgi:hypothetical protein